MLIARIGRDGLLDYLQRQLTNFFPDGSEYRALLNTHLDAALQRLRHCINAVRPWQRDAFDVLHSSQYCQFLYYLANTVWRESGQTELPTKLFLLNKALNGIDCFYEIQMPDVFYIGHSVGIVLAKASYGERLVLYQNSTVGKNHGVAPVLEDGVVLYANSAVIGGCRVGAGTVLSQGCSLVNHDAPAGVLVFSGVAGKPVFKPQTRPPLAQFFRD